LNKQAPDSKTRERMNVERNEIPLINTGLQPSEGDRDAKNRFNGLFAAGPKPLKRLTTPARRGHLAKARC